MGIGITIKLGYLFLFLTLLSGVYWLSLAGYNFYALNFYPSNDESIVRIRSRGMTIAFAYASFFLFAASIVSLLMIKRVPKKWSIIVCTTFLLSISPYFVLRYLSM